mmetsp:Transcript_7501/g.16194  ORF Transcript_7501/g.16194 Transcript_7501/m.16194 type:complete len:126 (-) Transcript_7501:239-616(-)
MARRTVICELSCCRGDIARRAEREDASQSDEEVMPGAPPSSRAELDSDLGDRTGTADVDRGDLLRQGQTSQVERPGLTIRLGVKWRLPRSSKIGLVGGKSSGESTGERALRPSATLACAKARGDT